MKTVSLNRSRRVTVIDSHTAGEPTRVVVSNSFGFGGCNTCLVLRKVP